MSGWISRLLTTAKQGSDMWVELADAIKSIVDTYPEPYIDRLKSRISLFDQNEEDLRTVMLEMEDFFTTSELNGDTLPIVIMQRKDQVHMKRTVYPLNQTLKREFPDLDVSWQPLYAPIDQDAYPYGELFEVEENLTSYESLGLERSDWFKTSRGVIRVPRNKLSTDGEAASDDDIADFEEQLLRIVYPLIPLRIVCDGQQYYIEFSFTEAEETISQTSTATTYVELAEADIQIVSVPEWSVNQAVEIEDTGRGDWDSPAQIRMDMIDCDDIGLDRNFGYS